jgi:hypothetical protein
MIPDGQSTMTRRERVPGLMRAARLAERLLEPLHRRPLLLGGLFLAAVVLVVMSRLLPGRGVLVLDDIWTSDLLNNNVPPRAFLGAELRAGRLPLWEPGIYGGLPLLPQGEAGATNPITLLLYGLLPWITATNASVALHTWLAGFGTVLCARRLGARLPSALVAGVAFMLCGFLVEHVKHMNLHHAAAWLPWLVHGVDRLREKATLGTALALGAVAALQITEGHPQMCYVSLVLLVPFLLYRWVEAGPRGELRSLRYWRRAVVAGAGAVATATLLSGAYLGSAFELLASSERWAEKTDLWRFCTHFEFIPDNILTLFWANVFGDGSNATYDPRHGLFWESWLYVGTVPVAAAALALGWGIRRAFARDFKLFGRAMVLLALGALAFALMMGKRSFVYALAFQIVPGMTWFRFHHRFALVLELAVVLLAALGLDALLRALTGWWGKRRAAAVGALLVLATAGDMVHIMKRHFPAVPSAKALALPPTARLLLERKGGEPWRVHTTFGPEAHVEAFDRARAWGRSLQPYVDQWSLLQPSMHLLWGLDSAVGYTSIVPYDVALILGSHTVGGALVGRRTHSAQIPPGCGERKDRPRFHGPCAAKLACNERFAVALGAFNVRYLVTPAEAQSCPGWTLVEQIPVGMYDTWVYENERWLPRAYVVDEAIDVAGTLEAADRLVRPGFDPRRQVLRRSAVATSGTAAGSTVAPKRSARHLVQKRAAGQTLYQPCSHETLAPGKTRVRCELERPGFLVISETRYPGQRVTLDGKPVETFVANGITLGLAVERGSHEVVVEFRPWYRWLAWGAPFAWLGLAVAGAIGFRGRGRSRSAGSAP